MAELDAMTPRFDQWLPGEKIPEKHWMYRLAKKHWFGDFGAYRTEPASEEKRAHFKVARRNGDGNSGLPSPVPRPGRSFSRHARAG